MSEEEKPKRAGKTIVTSVSVSDKFMELIGEHNLSPTECFRRGIAVTLYDLGVDMYQSEKNTKRSKFMHEFLKRLEADEKLQAEYENMKLFEKIKQHLNAIKKITEDIDQNEKG